MTLPRPVCADDTIMATKRCIDGRMKLRPDPDTVQAYLYALGYCQKKYGVKLHEFVVMSNHDHPVYTAPLGNGPLFIQTLHSLVARAVNCRWGEWDKLWSGQRHSAVKLPNPEDVESRCKYALLNPPRAGLVRYASDWAGPTSWHMRYGVPITVRKPDFFFSDSMPDEVTVTIERPKDLYPGLSDAEARRKLLEGARREQSEFIAEFKAKGGVFMGMKRVLRQPRERRPNSHLQRRGIVPHVASRSRWARVEQKQRLVGFWDEHEAARRRFCDGERDVLFPPETYKMHVLFGCRRGTRADANEATGPIAESRERPPP